MGQSCTMSLPCPPWALPAAAPVLCRVLFGTEQGVHPHSLPRWRRLLEPLSSRGLLLTPWTPSGPSVLTK